MRKLKAKYDVIIFGSGPSAYTSALHCAKSKLKVLCLDNLSAKPDKSLLPGIFTHPNTLATLCFLEGVNCYSDLINNLNGIEADNLSCNLSQLIARKNQYIASLNQTYHKNFKELGIDFFNLNARLISSNTVEILSFSPPYKIQADNIILATESIPITIPCAPIDNKHIYDAASSFNIDEIPNRLGILGAGIVGLELASIWRRLGAETILLEAQETFLNIVDNQISREAYKCFTGQGMELRLGARVTSTKIINNKVHIEFQDSDGFHAIRVDKLIVASGRKPNTQHLAAPEANLLLDENHFIHVTEKCRTNLPNTYAIGDLNMLGPMLPHKGIAEAQFVTEQILGIQGSPVNYETIPNVIFTYPQIAWVGQTEQALKSKGHPIKVGISSINPKTHKYTPHSLNAFVKVIACAKSDKIKGIHIFANIASELIAEATLAMEFSATTEDIARTSHSHPSVAESIRNACQNMLEKAK